MSLPFFAERSLDNFNFKIVRHVKYCILIDRFRTSNNSADLRAKNNFLVLKIMLMQKMEFSELNLPSTFVLIRKFSVDRKLNTETQVMTANPNVFLSLFIPCILPKFTEFLGNF